MFIMETTAKSPVLFGCETTGLLIWEFVYFGCSETLYHIKVFYPEDVESTIEKDYKTGHVT